MAGEALGDHPAGQRGIGQGVVLVGGGKGAEPFLGVEHQGVAVDVGGFLVVDVEDLGVEHLTGGFVAQQQEQRGVGEPLVELQPHGVVVFILHHVRVGMVERCHGHQGFPPNSSWMRVRSTGRSSSSNHGFFFSHPVLRQDG